MGDKMKRNKKIGEYYHISHGETFTIPRSEIGQLLKIEHDFFGNPKGYLRTLTGGHVVVPLGDLHKVSSPRSRNLRVCPRCGTGVGYGDEVFDHTGHHVIGCVYCTDPTTKMIRLF